MYSQTQNFSKQEQQGMHAGVIASIFMNIMLDIKKKTFVNTRFKEAVASTNNLIELFDKIAVMPGKDRVASATELLAWLKQNNSHKVTPPIKTLADLAHPDINNKLKKSFYNLAIYYLELSINAGNDKVEIQKTLAALVKKMTAIEKFMQISHAFVLNTANQELKQYYQQLIQDIYTWLDSFTGNYEQLDKRIFAAENFTKKIQDIDKIIKLVEDNNTTGYLAALDQLAGKIQEKEGSAIIAQNFIDSARNFYTKKLNLIKEQPSSINPSNISLITSATAAITKVENMLLELTTIKADIMEAKITDSAKLLIVNYIETIQININALTVNDFSNKTQTKPEQQLAMLHNLTAILASINPQLDKDIASLKHEVAAWAGEYPYLDWFFAPIQQFLTDWKNGFTDLLDQMNDNKLAQHVQQFYVARHEKLTEILAMLSGHNIREKLQAFTQIKHDILALSNNKIPSRIIDEYLRANFVSTAPHAGARLVALKDKIKKKQEQQQLIQNGYALGGTVVMKQELLLIKAKKQVLEAAVEAKRGDDIGAALKELRDAITSARSDKLNNDLKNNLLAAQIKLFRDAIPDPDTTKHLLEAKREGNVSQVLFEKMIDFCDDGQILEQLVEIEPNNITKPNLKLLQKMLDEKGRNCTGQIESANVLSRDFREQIDQCAQYCDDINHIFVRIRGIEYIQPTIAQLTQVLDALEAKIDEHQSSVKCFFISAVQWSVNFFSEKFLNQEHQKTNKEICSEQKAKIANIRAQLTEVNDMPYEDIELGINNVRDRIKQVADDLNAIACFGPVHFVTNEGVLHDQVVFRPASGLNHDGTPRFD